MTDSRKTESSKFIEGIGIKESRGLEIYATFIETFFESRNYVEIINKMKKHIKTNGEYLILGIMVGNMFGEQDAFEEKRKTLKKTVAMQVFMYAIGLLTGYFLFS